MLNFSKIIPPLTQWTTHTCSKSSGPWKYDEFLTQIRRTQGKSYTLDANPADSWSKFSGLEAQIQRTQDANPADSNTNPANLTDKSSGLVTNPVDSWCQSGGLMLLPAGISEGRTLWRDVPRMGGCGESKPVHLQSSAWPWCNSETKKKIYIHTCQCIRLNGDRKNEMVQTNLFGASLLKLKKKKKKKEILSKSVQLFCKQQQTTATLTNQLSVTSVGDGPTGVQPLWANNVDR